MAALIQEPAFKKVIATVLPGVDFEMFCKQLLSISTIEDFQKKVIVPFLCKLVSQTTDGLCCNGIENLAREKNYLLMSNHRDIVLDASFLCKVMEYNIKHFVSLNINGV